MALYFFALIVLQVIKIKGILKMKCDLSDDFSVAMVGVPSVMLGLILGWTTANVPTVDITHEISSVFCKINAK